MTPLRLLVCFLCLLPVQAAKTACKVPSVRESDTTTLTCYFSENVSQSKKDFAVYHHSGNERPDPVVDCLWVTGALKCYVKPGYTYDNSISNETSVQIPRVSTNQTGKYKCQISGLPPEDFEFCELFISPETRTCELQSQESTSERNLTCIFPENIAQSKNDFAVYHFDDLGRQVVVVDCFWYMDNLSCKTHPGYQSDNKVTDRFKVRISQTSQHRNGSYLCEMSGSSTSYVSICSFPQGGHAYQMATDVAQESSNAAAAVLGILLAIALAVIVCVIIYIKCKHPQVLQNITRFPNQKKEEVRSVEGDGEEAKGLMKKRVREAAGHVRSLFTNAVQSISRGRNEASTDLEMNDKQEDNISDEQFHRKGKARSIGVETDRVMVKAAGVQVTEEDVRKLDPKPRSVPETSAVTTRQPEYPSDVTVEVQETSDSTNKKKSKFSFPWSNSKNKEKESKRPPEKDIDTPGDSKHAGIHHSTKNKAPPDDKQPFERRNKDELSRENVHHGQDRPFLTGHEAQSRRQPSEAVKYPEETKYSPENAASASAVPKSRTHMSEEIHTADSKRSRPQEDKNRQTDEEVDTPHHNRPVETRPQSRGDKRDSVPVKSSVPIPSGYAGYPEDPKQRSRDELIIARGQAPNVSAGSKVNDTPQAPADARALQKSGSVAMQETGAEETSDKKISRNKKSTKQDGKESDGKDKSKGGFFRRSSSKKQEEGKAPATLLPHTMYDDTEEVDIEAGAPNMSGEHEDSKRTEKKKKKGLFRRSSSKKDAKPAAAATPLLGDKMNENAEEASTTDPQQELIKNSDKRKDSKKKKEKEKTSRKDKAQSQ